MAKAPAVQFYTGDFLTGTALMSNAEVGLYIRLLCLQAEHGSVPDDVNRIVQAFGQQARSLWPVVREKFVPGVGGLVNERMAEVIAAREAFRAKQSAKGKASAEARSVSGSTVVQPQTNRGSTTVEPLGDGDRVISQKGKVARTIAERIADFTAEVKRINAEKRTLSEVELIKFIAHWTQAGPNDRKFHAEKQQTFGIPGRLIGWAGNVKTGPPRPQDSATRRTLETDWDKA